MTEIIETKVEPKPDTTKNANTGTMIIYFII